jgi:D-psicose/D-tagatose/L-ribulose 3-epimerase
VGSEYFHWMDLEVIRDAGYNGSVSIELERSPDPKRIVEWVEEAYRETDRMIRSLKIRDSRLAAGR